MEPSDLFVFAGAGLSRSMPANLPLFWEIRDAVLHGLGLDDYVAGSGRAEADKVSVAEGLLPEPFLLALTEAGVPVGAWLSQLLSVGRPNAAHRVVAGLAEAGARVWTVNFDRLLEDAAPGLRVVAWPGTPTADTQLAKPHGTLGGELIVTARQVLQPLSAQWRERLAEDVAGRTVAFIGYSGNDLDFRPVWDDVLADAERVIWFDRDDPDDQERKRLMLRTVSAAGRLEFPPCQPPAGRRENPSYDFVRFAIDEGLVPAGIADPDTLYHDAAEIQWPPLPRSLAAESDVRATLGDVPGARRRRLVQVAAGPGRLSALKALVALTITHGNRPVSMALAAAHAVIPPVGPGPELRAVARRKRVTILANRGRHRAVLRATRRRAPGQVSTELVLRSASERYLVSLDAAEETAATALRQALDEGHNVRVAHAAYQRATALVWAERLDEARECLDHQLEPYARLATNRWVAWADFVAGQLLVRSPRVHAGDEARAHLDLSRTRFQTEALVDGVVSARTAILTARRRAGDVDGFATEAEDLAALVTSRAEGRFYARAHRFTLDAIKLELAEHARVHQGDRPSAQRRYRSLANSPFPLQRALGLLGLALTANTPNEADTWARRALETAGPFGARLIATRAQDVLDHTSTARSELFFC